jgi:hypothetical protein
MQNAAKQSFSSETAFLYNTIFTNIKTLNFTQFFPFHPCTEKSMLLPHHKIASNAQLVSTSFIKKLMLMLWQFIAFTNQLLYEYIFLS